MVANADGTDVVAASPELIEVQAFDWSPAGDRLALLGDIRCGRRRRPSSWPPPTGPTWSELDTRRPRPARLGRLAAAGG